jgi:hypothetical protein
MKNFRPLAVILVLMLVLGAAWWFWHSPAAPVASDKPLATKAPDAGAPKPAVSTGIASPKIAPPVAQPVTAATKPSAATAAAPAPTPTGDAQPQADLNDCIAQTIKLLEAKDMVGVIKTAMPPDALQKMIASGRVSSAEDVAAQLMQDPNFEQRMTQMLQELHAIQGQTPEMNADGTEAKFPNLTAGGGPDNMTFTKIDGYWYIK